MMIASVPLLLGWKFANILTPIHVIFLELIMGPTCSIFFEREPVEANLMNQPPRHSSQSMFEKGEIIVSGVQGLVIATAILTTSYFLIRQGFDLPYIRTVLFSTLIISNVFLTLADRSFTETIFKTIHYPNKLRIYIFLFPVVLLALLHFVPSVRSLFELVTISAFHFLLLSLWGLAQ